MRRDDRRRLDRVRNDLRRKARPRVEGLEARYLLYATSGGAWPHPNLITYSFVPDGTNIGGYASNLSQTFNARWSTATWEGVFTQAAAIWEQVANVNFAQVSDSGAPMSSGPYEQGDPTMGDIRISGLPSSVIGSGTLGYTLLPPPINGGSEAGDIIMNTSQPWQINADYDLLTVAIHEFGHALGMDHSAISTADMYAVYTGIKQTTTADDVAGIDAIYGARQPDWFTSTFKNGSVSTAADITPYLNAQGQFGFWPLDIQTPYSGEWFKVTVPANATNSMVVTMQASGLSLLSPYVMVYNYTTTSGYQYVGASGTYNAYGSTASLKINGVTPGQVYYIRALGYGGPAADDGNYGLQVNFSSSILYPIPSPSTTTLAGPAYGGGITDQIGGGHGHGHGGHDGNDTGPWTIPDWLSDFGGDALTIGGDGSGSSDQGAAAGASSGPILLALIPDPTGDGSTDPSPLPAGPRWWAGKGAPGGRTASLVG